MAAVKVKVQLKLSVHRVMKVYWVGADVYISTRD